MKRIHFFHSEIWSEFAKLDAAFRQILSKSKDVFWSPTCLFLLIIVWIFLPTNFAVSETSFLYDFTQEDKRIGQSFHRSKNHRHSQRPFRKRHASVRFATFNASLNRNNAGELITDLSTPDNAQAKAIAEIIQRVNPDVLLINEFDFDKDGQAALLFQTNYLSVSQNGAAPVEFPFVFLAPSNTGIPSGLDLDNDQNGSTTGPGDAYGFGFFPGQFAMVVLSKYPIVESDTRTFQQFLWKDMPGALLPDDPETLAPADWYSIEELEAVRLSSKSHWDVPIDINGKVIHVLASHPTPPVFDGPEDRNGRRNHDEIRFWADYVRPNRSVYISDDQGNAGGLSGRARFVIMGDLNADPFDGDSTDEAVLQLLNHPRINTRKTPKSRGGREAARVQGKANLSQLGKPEFDTADFGDVPPSPGNLRVDYVLPSKNLKIKDSGVFWPKTGKTFSSLVSNSDHRLVWVDVKISR